MSKINDGGPAFPQIKSTITAFSDDGVPLGSGITGFQAGMSLRDWFAGQALVGICSRTQGVYVWNDPPRKKKEKHTERSGTLNSFFGEMATDEDREQSTEFHVRAAYEYADAMLAVRAADAPAAQPD